MNDVKIQLMSNTLEKLREVSTATITMILLERGIRSIFIEGVRPLNIDNCNFVAEAFTLRLIPYREDLWLPEKIAFNPNQLGTKAIEVMGNPQYTTRVAIENFPKGHALIVDARGDLRAGTMGDIIAARLKEKGCAGIVSDGAVRDVAGLKKIGIPIFGCGVAAPAMLNYHYAIDMQLPIACGGISVFPGDIIVGDEDGVVAIPRLLADEVAEEGVAQERLESFLAYRISQGHPIVGTYPPNTHTLEAYAEWCKKK